MLEGITHYRKNQLPSSLIFLWSASEFAIDLIWDTTIPQKGKGISGRKKFIEGSSWNTSHKIEVLFQRDIISNDLYEKLNIARDARNKLSHKGVLPNITACENCLNAVLALLSLQYSELTSENIFLHLGEKIKSIHKTDAIKSEPKFWRQIEHVPGSKEWGESSYPKHPEIELVPLKK